MEIPSITLSAQDVESLWQWAVALGNNPISFSIKRGYIHAQTEGGETEIIKQSTEWQVPYERTARYLASQFANALNQVRNSGPVRFLVGVRGHLYLQRYPEVATTPLNISDNPPPSSQILWIRARCSVINGAIKVEILENDTPRQDLIWDASLLANRTGSGVELKLRLTNNLTSGIYIVDKIDWLASESEPENPDGSGSSGNGGSGSGGSQQSNPEWPDPLRVVPVVNVSQLLNALANAQPGDHIVLADGTYNLDTRMQLTQSGTEQAPIVIRAQNILGAKIPKGFEYATGTSHIWLWGIDFKDATACRLQGQFHKIRRCRFWPKPNYANNGWSAAITPYNGSDCEISYCELRMHTREEALAENGNLWGTNTTYGVIWSYFNTSNTPFYRLKIARCLLTGGPRDVPYSQPNCQFIEASTTPSNGYNIDCDWTIQDCYGDTPRNSTILDFKCRGMKLLRSHIICPTNAAFQFREGREHRIERCRLGGYIDITRGPGNVIANTVAHNMFVMAGILPYNQFGNNNGDVGQAYRTVIANCNSLIIVGKKYNANYTYPALETLIEQHTGTISYDLHSQTTVRSTLQDSGVTAASPVTMTADEVGPNAPWVGID